MSLNESINSNNLNVDYRVNFDFKLEISLKFHLKAIFMNKIKIDI